LHAVAELGVADALGDTPQPTASLAETTAADAGALDRVLRLLALYGVFEYNDGVVGHTVSSRMLREDHPQSMRSLVRMFGLPGFWATVGELTSAVRSGKPSADRALPGGIWGYLKENPEASRIFGQAMTGKAQGHIAGILGVYDFSGLPVIADIGGGHGHLIRAIVAATPSAQGVLFDLPHVIAEAAGSASERLTLQAGDFFEDTLPICDVYLLMEIIHDWGDEQALAILKAIRHAAPSQARLLVIEQMVPDDPGPHWSKMVDIHMLTLVGGRQRTQQEYAALFDQAGFCFEREIDTGSDISILEAVAA